MSTIIFMVMSVEAQVGVEQYYYIGKNQVMIPVSIVDFQSSKNFYVEARHNYDASNTLSIYMGKTFSSDGNVKYSITPIAGALVGKLKGGSMGVNAIAEYKDFFFSVQSQYTFSHKEKKSNFFYAWSELNYQACQWFFLGLSAQNTYVTKVKPCLSETGFVLGFTLGKWTFPLYCFNPVSDNRYFIVGINFNGGSRNRK